MSDMNMWNLFKYQKIVVSIVDALIVKY